MSLFFLEVMRRTPILTFSTVLFFALTEKPRVGGICGRVDATVGDFVFFGFVSGLDGGLASGLVGESVGGSVEGLFVLVVGGLEADVSEDTNPRPRRRRKQRLQRLLMDAILCLDRERKRIDYSV
jgi:hypothetical protein